MSTTRLCKLEVLPVRQVWPLEDEDFTPWLAENLEMLGDLLRMELDLVRSEIATGPFFLDILAKVTGSEIRVAIENQLELSDHDHLGKVLTFAAGHDTRCLVWVAPHFTDEHLSAIEWLNRWTSDEIEVYGIEVRVLRIDDSAPAPELRIAVAPQAHLDRIKQAADRALPINQLYRNFFQPIIGRLHELGYTDRTTANARPFQLIGTGLPFREYYLWFWRDQAGVELRVISDDGKLTNQIFDTLREQHQEAMERGLGSPLQWDRSGDRKWAFLDMTIAGTIYHPEEELDNIRTWIVESFPKFRDAIQPRLDAVLRRLEAEGVLPAEQS